MLSVFKKVKIGKNEIIVDLILLLVAMLASAIAIFIFDIHWSFYPGNSIFPPNKYIFTTLTPFYVGIPLGGIVGFILLKLLFYAFMKEEDDHLADVKVKKKKKSKPSK